LSPSAPSDERAAARQSDGKHCQKGCDDHRDDKIRSGLPLQLQFQDDGECRGQQDRQVWDYLRDDPRFGDILARQAAWKQIQARLAEEQGSWLS